MKDFFTVITCDIRRNKNNIKILLLLLCFRVAHLASIYRKKSLLSYPITLPILVLYRFMTEWVLHLELPAALSVGKGLIIDHGYNIVINKHTIIGELCRIRHGVTIGCKILNNGEQGGSPRIGNFVDIGASAIIIGDIVIGDNVKIGAGAVVTKNIESNMVVVGNPARSIERKIFHENITY